MILFTKRNSGVAVISPKKINLWEEIYYAWCMCVLILWVCKFFIPPLFFPITQVKIKIQPQNIIIKTNATNYARKIFQWDFFQGMERSEIWTKEVKLKHKVVPLVNICSPSPHLFCLGTLFKEIFMICFSNVHWICELPKYLLWMKNGWWWMNFIHAL